MVIILKVIGMLLASIASLVIIAPTQAVVVVLLVVVAVGAYCMMSVTHAAPLQFACHPIAALPQLPPVTLLHKVATRPQGEVHTRVVVV